MSTTLAPCPRCERINRVPLSRAKAETPVCGNCASPLPVEHGIVQVNGTALQHLIQKSHLPVFTDFWAPACVPCRMFKPAVEHVAEHFADQLIFTSLNSMEHVIAADAHAIKSLPTIVIFRSGGEVARHFGAISEEALSQWLGSVLEGPFEKAA